jgi:hypothetical protein
MDRSIIAGLFSFALGSSLGVIAKQIPIEKGHPTTLPASNPSNGFAFLARSADFFSAEECGVVHFQSVSRIPQVFERKSVLKGTLYFRRSREGLSVRCVLMRPARTDASKWVITLESVLTNGTYRRRDYEAKEECSEKLPGRLPTPTLQELTPFAFPYPFGHPVRSITNFYDVGSAERASGGVLRVDLTEQRGADVPYDRVTLEVDETGGQLRHVTARTFFGQILDVTYDAVRNVKLADDAFKFEGSRDGDWRDMTPEKEARRNERYRPKPIDRDPERKGN